MKLYAWIRNWKRSLERRWALHQAFTHRSIARRRAARLNLEALEDRFLLSAYVVTSGGDTNTSGTLRYGINQANMAGSTITEIDFAIPTTGTAQSINLTSALPTLTASGVYINGLSEGGSGNTTPLITLNGTSAGAGDGLDLTGASCTVSGLIIENFSGNGITINGSNNIIGGSAAGAGDIISGNSGDGVLIGNSVSGVQVQGNYIGTDVTGTKALANNIGIEDAGSGNTIGSTVWKARNVISANSKDGLLLDSTAKGETVLGNYFGLSASGSALGNSGNGIEVQGTNNSIGGTDSGADNQVSGNGNDGVLIDSAASGNHVLGNDIGLDTYSQGVGNAANGVEVAGSSNSIGGNVGNYVSGNSKDGVLLDSSAKGNSVQENWIGIDITGEKALPNSIGIEDAGSGNTIGGTVSSGPNNVISGNSKDGLLLDSTAKGETVQGNYFGLLEFESSALGNSGNGIEVQGTNNSIGGSVGAARNFVSGNSADGVLIDSAASGNQVLGNYIGLDTSGYVGVGNGGNGVNVGGNNETVGAGNLISANSLNGVLVRAGAGDTITHNSIFANTGSGISLASGTNNNIAAPTISSASITGYTLTVKGSFTAATANVPYVLQFFGSADGDAEGRAYIGSLTVTPTGTGSQSFSYTTTTTVPRTYPLVTTTVTDNAGNTSQFSNGADATKIYTVTSAADTGTGSLRDAITQANNTTSGITTIDFAINPTNRFKTIIPASALPALTANNVFINGLSQGYLNNTTPLIALLGSNAGTSDGLLLQGSSDVVSGLTIASFSKNGIEDSGANNTIGGPVIVVPGSNNSVGGDASGLGNLLFGNTNDGLLIDSAASGVAVEGNFVGNGGYSAAANLVGIEVAGSTNTIGGTVSGAVNVISGNTTDGVLIDSTATGLSVQGNYIGADVTGAKALANGTFGINVEGSKNTIGGTVTGAGNVISGNGSDGVFTGISVSGLVVQGNYIGTDHTGANPLGNSDNGINIGGSNNTVGTGNIIADNSKNGVLISSGSGNQITQNSIFTNTGLGISVTSGANNNIAAPSISSASISGYTLTVKGKYTAATANVPYVLEFFGSANGDAEGKAFIGSLTLTPTTTGSQNFTYSPMTLLPRYYPLITATLTDNSGDTSQFSNGKSSGVIYTVTSTADSGTGSLRDAITQANNTTSGITTIDFAIGTSGSAQTISPASALPTLTANGVFINALSQGGISNTTPLITLSGTGAGSTSDGLLLQGSNDVVAGLLIQSFGKNGIEIAGANNTIGGSVSGGRNVISKNGADGVLIDSGSSGNQVLGNYIGINSAGNTASANSGRGVEVAGNGNIVGGSASAARNLISGNSNDGVLIDSTSSGDQVLGNFIGLDVTGTKAVGNSGNGVEVAGSSNIIGGSASATRNLISGNSNDGVLIDSTSSGDRVLGNFIGLDVTGTKAVGNSGNGVEVAGSTNTIGGTVSGASNFVSGNSKDGVLLDSTASKNLVVFNDIGTDKTGNVGVGNSSNGIEVMGNGNTVGGTSGNVRNIMAGNSGDGVRIDSGATGNVLLGDYMGVNASSAALANSGNGVNVIGNGNTIGGTVAGSRNTIAGNTADGVLLASGGSGNVVQGNYIGINASSAALANSGNGVEIAGKSNTIGGTVSAASNVISANSKDGVLLDSAVSGNLVASNYIGLNSGGTAALANSIGIEDAGTGNTLGGTVSTARNVISGNTKDGILLDSTAKGETVQGNYIGLNSGGTAAVANSIGIEDAGNANFLGGTVGGAKNVISGNSKDGLLLDSTAKGETIQANYIGLNAAGTAVLANGSNGIEIQGTLNTIGASVSAARNFVSGNSADGVLIDSAASGNQVLGNYMGLDTSGTHGVGNVANGVEVAGTSNSIGGSAAGAGNFVSANSKVGVLLDSTASKNLVAGNDIGTDKTGNVGVSNSGNGIEVLGNGNTVGGTSGYVRNIIAGNSSDGLRIDSGVSGNLVQGNFIGVNASSAALANSGYGINLFGNNDTIGGTAAGSRNVIGGNTGGGIVFQSSASGNQVQDDYIGLNAAGSAVGNTGDGILILGVNNIIGGTTSAAHNVISANSNDGVQLSGAASGNQVLGNSIGLNASGTAAVANSIGIEDAGSGNTLGGTVSGARNYISGNSNDGILLDSTAKGETLLGNYIGLNATGSAAVGNGGNGMEVEGINNTIGGSVAGAGNYLSGNSKDGLLLDSTASGNLVSDNDVGTDNTSKVGAGNSGIGIEVMGSGNTLGGTSGYVRNLIADNGSDGLRIDSGASGNLLLGNSIGVNASSVVMANSGNGLDIIGTSNTVGGMASGARNIIAGNTADGVLLASGASGNLLLGNNIGVNASGGAVANSGNGVEIASNSNTIGGTVSAASNVISANSKDGVLLDSGVSGNQVLGNYIGVNAGAIAAVANSIGIEDAGSGNTLGGTVSGARNYISGNSQDGLLLDSAAKGELVQGNYIGLNGGGTAALGNSVGIEDAGSGNTLGGTVGGAKNVVAGNSKDGVLLDSSARGETVQGNYIGLNASGSAALANGSNGVEVQGVNNSIGGIVSADRNFVSGNGADGVLIDSAASGNQVLGNFIGLGTTGTVGVGNDANGVEIAGSSNTIGSTVAGAGNYVSANSKDGVLLDSTASANLVVYNGIGTDKTGNVGLGNGGDGIEIAGNGNTVGGISGYVRNIIAANSGDGVRIDSGAIGNLLQGNNIGVNSSSAALGNSGNGVTIIGNSNTIGGTASGAKNIIANNTSGGVQVSTGVGDTISRNSIFANGGSQTGPGIVLTNGGNNNLAAPTITFASVSGSTLTVKGTFTAPTANVPYVLEFFANPTGDAEGEIYLGSITVTPTSTGTQSFTYSTTNISQLGTYPVITATLTDNIGDTSAFSNGATS